MEEVITDHPCSFRSDDSQNPTGMECNAEDTSNVQPSPSKESLNSAPLDGGNTKHPASTTVMDMENVSSPQEAASQTGHRPEPPELEEPQVISRFCEDPNEPQSEDDIPLTGAMGVQARRMTQVPRSRLISCIRSLNNCTGSIQKVIDRIFNSRPMIAVYIVLMAFPAYSIRLASLNVHSCANFYIPLFILLGGICAVLMLIFRIWSSLGYVARPTLWTPPAATYLLCYHFMIMFLAWEIFEYNRTTPSDDPESDKYCDPSFYRIANVINIVTGLFLIVVPMLYSHKIIHVFSIYMENASSCVQAPTTGTSRARPK